MAKKWTAEAVLEMAREYQRACVLTAAADLDLYTGIGGAALGAGEAAAKLNADARGVRVLLDALAALGLLVKKAGKYRAAPGLSKLLSEGPGSVLAMTQHQANCMRRWDQLAAVVKQGKPAEKRASIRGADADYASFIEAMNNLSGPVAGKLVKQIKPPQFSHLLDVGGGSGTWTIAFLKRNAKARGTIFDLPKVKEQARRRIASAGLSDRVEFVAGDFYQDELPPGANLAWVSAIVHQSPREQNRMLFAKAARALAGGGHVLIRDILMEESRTAPVSGALFAVNMLVGTEGGGTYTFDELREDLESAGFVEAKVLRRDPGMNSVVQARKAG